MTASNPDAAPSDGRVSFEGDQSSNETAYLLRNADNAWRLATAIERLEAGHGAERDLAE